MNQDLIERYIYAVTRRLPRCKQEDVAKELRGLVEDMLLERCGEAMPEEKDVRVVLTELGSPQELYEKYDENSGKCLIGQPYFSTYVFVLKIALLAAAFGLTISAGIIALLEPGTVWEGIGSWLSMLYNGLLSAFAIVTLLFAFFYRKHIPLSQPFNFDDLPPVPKENEVIPKWECIAGICISVIFATVFLAFPQVLGAYLPGEGGLIPIFDSGLIHKTWYLVLLFSLCGIVRESVKLQERRYNRRVLVTTVFADVTTGVLTIWWLAGYDLMNPVFIDKMTALLGEGGGITIDIFSHFQGFFLGVILFALTLDTIEAVVKTRKAG